MKNLIIIGLLLSFTSGCATSRTRYSDAQMRIAIDARSIDKKHHDKLLTAVKSGEREWQVIDRAAGFRFTIEEQDREHGKKTADRFLAEDKYAHWGKLYGVGAVLIASAECQDQKGLFNSRYMRCDQHLRLVSTRTGEVIIAVSYTEDGPTARTYHKLRSPEWNEIVEKMNEVYPEKFETNEINDELKEYRTESARIAKEKSK